jgi:hypothetical protein
VVTEETKTEETNIEDRKKVMCDLIAELKVDADRILQVAPNSLPPQVKGLLKVPQEEVATSLDGFLEQVPEEQRPGFLESLIQGADHSKKGHAELMDSLSRRIQPEDVPRTPPRKFQGFKKRRGKW